MRKYFRWRTDFSADQDADEEIDQKSKLDVLD